MSFPLFDSHCDTIYNITKKNMGLYINIGHTDLRKAKDIKPYCQFFALFADAKDTGELSSGSAEECYEKMLTKFRLEVFEKHPGIIALCRTAAEVRTAHEAGKAAAFLSVEGAELLGCTIARLERAYEDGIRMVTITWSHENALSGSASESPEKGLTPQGEAFVRRMHELNMLVDVSHLSDAGFAGVRDISREMGKPFIASHSNARTICPHERNLTDGQIKDIISLGGHIGLNLYAKHIKPGGGASLDDLYAHVSHFLALGAAKNLGIGGDLDGCEELPAGIEYISDFGKFYDYLLGKNLSEDMVRDIFYNNMMREVEKVCGI